LVYIFQVWYVLWRKIWQPWCDLIGEQHIFHTRKKV
jgi:hypothetical protein